MARPDDVLRGMDRRSRRFAAIYVDPDDIARWFRAKGAFHPEFPGLPDDAVLVSCGYDFFTHAIGFTFEHESFPEVPPGEMVPVLPLKVAFRERAPEDD